MARETRGDEDNTREMTPQEYVEEYAEDFTGQFDADEIIEALEYVQDDSFSHAAYVAEFHGYKRLARCIRFLNDILYVRPYICIID